jgi:hypothetical protein
VAIDGRAESHNTVFSYYGSPVWVDFVADSGDTLQFEVRPFEVHCIAGGENDLVPLNFDCRARVFIKNEEFRRTQVKTMHPVRLEVECR